MPPILVVDDEADLVASYERLLRRKGYGIVSAGSRVEGLRLVAREPLALVITDLRLPDGDGLDLVRAARRLPTPTGPAKISDGGSVSRAIARASSVNSERWPATP